MNSVLTRTGVAMVVAMAVAGALNYYHTVDERTRAYLDPWITHMIGLGPERYREVIAMVPAEAVVGYFSDAPDSVSAGGAVWWFALARYALAPRLVIPHEDSQKQDWIVGDFSKPVDLAQIERANRLKLVRDFGSGVVVFRSR